MGTVGYMSPEQVRGKACRSALRHFRLRRDSLRDALRQTRLPRRLSRRHDERDPQRGSAGTRRDQPQRLARARTHRPPLPGKKSRRAFSIRSRRGLQSRSAHRHFDLQPRRRASHPARRTVTDAPLALALAWQECSCWRRGRRSIVLRTAAAAANPTFHEVTFRNGTIWDARFAPDGQTIIYGAAWEGRPQEIFSTRFDSSDSRSVGLPPAQILSISSKGEMAISLHPESPPPTSRKPALWRAFRWLEALRARCSTT